MLSKKEIGMVALAGVGLVGVSYFTGALGGGGQTGEGVGQTIMGAPSGLPSTGVSSPKLAGAIGGMPTVLTSRGEAVKAKATARGFTPSKTSIVGRQVQVSPTYIPEASTQAYIANAGGTYVAPTFTGRVGTIGPGGSSYTPPTGLYPSVKKATSGGLTAKGQAVKAKVEKRQARGFVSYSGKKGSAAAQKAAYKARKG